VRAWVPIEHVKAVRAQANQKALLRDVEARLAGVGFAPTLAITQDPTDNQIFQALSRASTSQGSVSAFFSKCPSTSQGSVAAVLRVLSAQPVDEPALLNENTEGVLDPGLTADEIWTVKQALQHDTNPRHLYGLAETFAPFFPVAASIVAAKATLCEGRAVRNLTEILKANQARALAAAKKAAADKQFSSEEEALTWLRSPSAAPAEGLRQTMAEAGLRGGAVMNPTLTLAPPSEISVRPSTWHWESKLRELEASGDNATGNGPGLDDARAALERYAVETRVNGKSMPLSVARDEAKRAACDFMNGEMDAVQKAPKAVRDLGRALVTELGYGVCVVRLPDLLRAMPPTGQEGFVSPSTLQLVLATAKPLFSRVANKDAIEGVMSGLAKPEHPVDPTQHLLAKNQYERAERAIERRRWVDWYRRAQWQW
jgi:hypothetical protein